MVLMVFVRSALSRTGFFVAALTTLAVGGVACSTQRQNGQDCLKDDDCESDFCVAHVCVQSGAGQPAVDATAPIDSGSGTDAPTDASDSADDSPVDGAGEASDGAAG